MPRPDRAATPLTLVLAAALTAAIPAWAADPPPDKRLKELETQLEKQRAEHEQIKQRAENLGKELAQIKTDMVAAARSAQEHEDTLSDLEEQLSDLKDVEGEKARELERRREQMTGVLTALQRLAWRPSEALMAQPSSPADTVRSAILLRAVVPRIEESASELRQELDALTALRKDIGKQRQMMASTTAKLEGEHRRLRGLFQRKAQLQARTEEERASTEKRLGQMAAEAEDLRDLLARLEEERKRRLAEEAERRKKQEAERAARLAQKKQEKAEQREAEMAGFTPPPAGGRPFSQAQGEMPFPARGRLAMRFGQTNEASLPSKGITIETRSGAQVIAPYDGQVAFAGIFRGYGQLLIIEHGEGYHTLLAGMARIDASVGQKVAAGEPVGTMAEAAGDSNSGKPALYVELRRNGQPINPLPWLTARKTKVNG